MSPEDEAQAKLDHVVQLARMTQDDLFAEVDAIAAPAANNTDRTSHGISADELAIWKGLSDAANDPEVAEYLERAEASSVTFREAMAMEDASASAPALPVNPAIEARQQQAKAEKEAKAREQAEQQQRFAEIEAWRVENPDEYNLRRRVKRRNKRLKETKTLPRIYRRGKTAEEKRIEAKERKRKSRKTMTPEQKKADRKGPKGGNA